MTEKDCFGLSGLAITFRMSPKVAVIYLSYNTPSSEEDIGRCFRSLEAADYPKEAWHLIIVENPSKNGASIPFIQRDWMPKAGVSLPEITLIANEQDKGFAGANNVGWEEAKKWGADYLYLLNQDTSAAPGFLREAVSFAEAHPNAAQVQSRLMLQQDPAKLNSCGNALQMFGFGFARGNGKTLDQAAKITTPLFYASGAAVLVRMSAIEKIGLFDPAYYMYHEDTDLSWRARLAGFDIGYAEASVVYHHYEFSRSIKKFYWMERNRHLTNLVNYRFATWLLLLPALFFIELVMWAYALKSGWWREKIRSTLFFLNPVAWMWIAKRKEIVNGFRIRKDREVMESMTSRIEDQEVNYWWMKAIAYPILDGYFAIVKAVVKW